jgi:hypothetical protein
VSWVPLGRQWVTKRYALFCGKTPHVFGVEVYRKSTGVLDVGKSKGKGRSWSDGPEYGRSRKEPNNRAIGTEMRVGIRPMTGES